MRRRPSNAGARSHTRMKEKGRKRPEVLLRIGLYQSKRVQGGEMHGKLPKSHTRETRAKRMAMPEIKAEGSRRVLKVKTRAC